MIVRLNDAGDVTKFGGKAANLAKLLNNGVNVPQGWAVSHDSFDVNGDLNEVDKLNLDFNMLYAVRSSATVEDAGDMSWAGQFDSYLYVPAKEVITKIKKCHTSSNTRTNAYATQSGQGHDFKIAVVVQEMIDPEYAGVLFTKNPVNGANELTVEYVKGIGEQLVSGKVTPLEFLWNRDSEVLTAKIPVPFETNTLISTSLHIEKLYNGLPQDIEWAVDKSGKLWIVQTRPITTLDIKHVGHGKHYLGDPKELFYWGPTSACPLYMSDFLSAEQDNFTELFNNPVYPNPPKTLLLFKDNKSLWLNNREAFVQFVEEIFKSYATKNTLNQDIEKWQIAAKKIDTRRTYKPLELMELLKKAWSYTLIAELALYGAEGAISKNLQSFSESDRHHIWGAFSLPDKPTFINFIDQDVTLLKDPLKLAIKYPWALNSYAGVGKTSSLVKYFAKRIKDLQDNNEVIVGSAAERLAVAKQYSLNNDVQDQLNLARNIAMFMDDRKVWMMQTRQSIHNSVQMVSKKKVKNIENCWLDDLDSNKVNSKQYYGWTYINGENLALSQEDVQRSWEWYVEYAAAEGVLQGVVSSRGGKHFMTGKVVVVHDPTQQIPPGMVLVVPSTSPSYVPIMRRAAALITDHGGMMSHAAIVAREFNLPCIVGTANATKVLKSGDTVVLDLVRGVISKAVHKQKSGNELSKFYESQIPFTEWLERIGHKDVKAMRVENNYKRERLGEIAEIIPFPFDKPTSFEASDLTRRAPNLIKYLEDHGEELCALRLIPKKGVHTELLRNRGKKSKDVMAWYDAQSINPKDYTAEFVPHMEVNKWATIFVVNEKGIFGEIISDGHSVLTQGFYGNAVPHIFTFDFAKWKIEPENYEALKYLKSIIHFVKVDNLTLQVMLQKKVGAQFIQSYMKGYFETAYSEETGTWFIDYNRLIDKNYEDFVPALIPRNTDILQGQVASAAQSRIKGIVRIIDNPKGVTLQSDEILVCQMTSPEFIPLMLQAKAVITDQGGILCHAAIVARELKIPCIVGTINATSMLKTGDAIEVDLVNGIITKCLKH